MTVTGHRTMVKFFLKISIRFDMIHERDRHTHRQTPHDGIGRAYAWHRASRQISNSKIEPLLDYTFVLTLRSVSGSALLLLLFLRYILWWPVVFRHTVISADNIRIARIFCRGILCISAAYAVMRCLSVCLSRSWFISKRINGIWNIARLCGLHIMSKINTC